MVEHRRDRVSLHVSIQASDDRDRALEELRAFFAIVRQHEFAEIWVDHAPFPSLCAQVHRESSWLMCLRYDGDAGFSSRNAAYGGSPDRTMEFMLSNGQVDRVPISWVYPTETVLDALLAFARDGRVPGFISWFNDSEDGTEGPNDSFEGPP